MIAGRPCQILKTQSIMKPKKYYASIYPDTFGNGEYDGKGTYCSGLESVERYSDNRILLILDLKRHINRTLYSQYPVVLEVADNKTGRPLERWRLDGDGGSWTRIYFSM